MPLTIAVAAPALLIGLGARIFLNQFTSAPPGDPSLRDFILVGAWQGVGLYYAYKKLDLALPVAFAIAAKLFVEFYLQQDTIRFTTTLLSLVLGALATDLLSQYLEPQRDRRSKKRHTGHDRHPHSRHTRVAHISRSEENNVRDIPHRENIRRTMSVSDITSVDANSLMFGPNPTAMTPLDREVAALRARASLADSERRRYKEETKWAIAQGNAARAAQMKWQMKRYTALMKSFHREADEKLVEASNKHAQQPAAAAAVNNTHGHNGNRDAPPPSSLDVAADQRKRGTVR